MAGNYHTDVPSTATVGNSIQPLDRASAPQLASSSSVDPDGNTPALSSLVTATFEAATGSAPHHPAETPTTGSPPDPQQRSTLQVTVIMCCLSASVFVAALDVTIIATALPGISAHFRSPAAYTWVGSAYVLAHTTSTPSWGKISDIWGRKPVLLAAVLIFLSGSIVCALVSSMAAFIAGRAVQGLGAAGLQTLVNICVGDLFSLRDRGLYFGVLSVVWAFASGVGPVLGGVFTQELTWRWCFYINLPITGLVFFLLLFTLHLDNPRTPLWRGLKAIDWAGSLLIAGGTLMILLGLTFGGVIHPWSSATVICLLVFGPCIWGLFILNESKVARYPLIPLRLFRSWSSVACFAVCSAHAFVFMAAAFFLPFYTQAVLGASPLLSGVYLLPLVISISVVAALTGVGIQKTGKYILTAYIGLPIMVLGTGLLIDLGVEAEWAKLILYQIVIGIGVGLNLEGPLIALQAVQPIQDLATATATFGFTRTLSTAVSFVIGGVVFQNRMEKEAPTLAAALGPELAAQLSGNDAMANVGLIKTLPPAQQLVAREALCRSLRTMWIMYVAFAALAWAAGFFIGVHPLSKEHKAAILGLGDEKEKAATDEALRTQM